MRRLIISVFTKTSRLLSRYGIGRFRFTRMAHSCLLNFLKTYLRPEFVTIQGHRIFLDSRDSNNLSIYGNYGYRSDLVEIGI